MLNTDRDEDRELDYKPPILKGWSTAGFLSVGANQPLAGDAVEAVILAVNFKIPSTYTLQFFSEGLAKPNPGGTAIQTLAEVLWSVSGNSVRRLISVLNGTALSGAGEGVSVRIFDFSGNTIVRSTYGVSVLLSPGIRGSTAQPPMLEIDNDLIRGGPVSLTINAGASGIFKIPPNSGVNSVWFSYLTSGGFVAVLPENLQFIQRNSITGIAQKGGDANVAFKWWPISPTADDIRVFNNTANAMTITPTWGVEG